MTITVPQIVAAVAKQAGITSAQVMGGSRVRRIAQTRQRAIWAVRKLKPWATLPRIGLWFRRDHTTVLYAIRMVEARIDEDPFEAEDCAAILRMFVGAEGQAPVGPLEPGDASLLAAALAGRTTAGCAAFAGMPYQAAKARLGILAKAVAKAAERNLVEDSVYSGKSEGLTFIGVVPTLARPAEPAPAEKSAEPSTALPRPALPKPALLAAPAPPAPPDKAASVAKPPLRTLPAPKPQPVSRPRPVQPAPARSAAAPAQLPAVVAAARVAKVLTAEDFEAAFMLAPKPPAGCKWPIGDPGEPGFRLCGKPREGARPYCTEHSEIAFQPKTKRREVDALDRLARRYN